MSVRFFIKLIFKNILEDLESYIHVYPFLTVKYIKGQYSIYWVFRII